MINFYKSDQKIWWNKGNEAKPNFKEFNAINWTKLPNFNVNWINELTINVTVSNDNEFDLLKIEDTINNEITYWYLETILNKTNENKKCIFTLDLWTTYILTKKFDLKRLSTNRYTNFFAPQYNNRRFTKADKIGYPTNNFNFEATEKKPFNIDNFLFNPEKPNQNQQFWKWQNLTFYYVFTDRHNDNFEGENSIIAIPVLFDDNFLNINESLSDNDFNKPDFIIKKSSHNMYVANSLKNLNYFVKNNKFWKDKHNVGEFLGVYQGPNIFRIKNELEAIIKIAGYRFNIENEVILEERQKGNDWSTIGFYCLRIPSAGLEIKNYDYLQYDNLIKKGLNQFNLKENINFALAANRVFFNNGFVLSTPEQTIELNTEIPFLYNGFYEIWAQQKASRDNSINIAKQQMAMGLTKGAFGFIGSQFNAIGNLMTGNIGKGIGSAILGGANSILSMVNTGLQWQNTLKTIEAQKQDLATRTNTEILNGNNSYYQELALQIKSEVWEDKTNQQHLGVVVTTNSEQRAKEFLYGNIYHDPTNQFNFLGWESNFFSFDQDIQQIERAYLIWKEDFKNVWLTNNVSPNIRNGIYAMLLNGVRIATKTEIENGFG